MPNQNEIYVVPGPTRPHAKVLDCYQHFFGSADLDPAFLVDYQAVQQNLQKILATQNEIAIMTGEGMLALWAGLKSSLQPGDKVLAIANGIFGRGIGELAKSLGATVEFVHLPFDQPLDLNQVETALKQFRPKMITAVHCETPSALVNPVTQIGFLKQKYQVPLFYVDAVASIAGIELKADAAQIDLCLGGSQKVLGLHPDLAFLSISATAFDIIERVNYQGYDALLPFKTAVKKAYFPYTPHWSGIKALQKSTEMILTESLKAVWDRHVAAKDFCRNQLKKIGFKLFVADEAAASATVTAAYLPASLSFSEFNQACQARGLKLAGSYGELNNKIFRIGHMGQQANLDLLKPALAQLEILIREVV